MSEENNVTDAPGVTGFWNRERAETMLDALATSNRIARASHREMVLVRDLLLFSLIVATALYIGRGRGRA